MKALRLPGVARIDSEVKPKTFRRTGVHKGSADGRVQCRLYWVSVLQLSRDLSRLTAVPYKRSHCLYPAALLPNSDTVSTLPYHGSYPASYILTLSHLATCSSFFPPTPVLYKMYVLRNVMTAVLSKLTLDTSALLLHDAGSTCVRKT